MGLWVICSDSIVDNRRVCDVEFPIKIIEKPEEVGCFRGRKQVCRGGQRRGVGEEIAECGIEGKVEVGEGNGRLERIVGHFG